MFDRSQLEEGGKSRGEEAAFRAKEKIFFSGERRRDLALPTHFRAFPEKKKVLVDVDLEKQFQVQYVNDLREIDESRDS